jgi:hypothetical protein
MRFTFEEIKNDLNENWENFAGLEEQDASDKLVEYADGYIPVYNHEIIKDWAEMPSEFNDSWKDQIGDEILDRGIISLMAIDLFTFYMEETTRAYDELKKEKGEN